jgi:hypothetical protein
MVLSTVGGTNVVTPMTFSTVGRTIVAASVAVATVGKWFKARRKSRARLDFIAK